MKKYLFLLFACMMIMSCFFGKTLVLAGEEESNDPCRRYYTTITVQKGDSLWSIAETYSRGSKLSIYEYIQELKAINGIASDRIHAGDYITIVYFTDQLEDSINP